VKKTINGICYNTKKAKKIFESENTDFEKIMIYQNARGYFCVTQDSLFDELYDIFPISEIQVWNYIREAEETFIPNDFFEDYDE